MFPPIRSPLSTRAGLSHSSHATGGAAQSRFIVRIFYSILDRCRIAPRDIDPAVDDSDAIADREEPRRWGFLDWDTQWAHLLRMP
jgi:hypothetical protein